MVLDKPKVIGLIGLKGSGKDTCAKYLVDKGFIRLAFADKLYEEVATAFNVTIDFLGNRDTKEKPLPQLTLNNCKDPEFAKICARLKANQLQISVSEYDYASWLSPREIMQFWGTDYKRKVVSDSYWLDVVSAEISKNPQGRFVITDARFNNEANFIENLGGVLIRIVRESLEKEFAKLDIAKQHPSETELRGRKVCLELINEEGDPDSLKKILDFV